MAIGSTATVYFHETGGLHEEEDTRKKYNGIWTTYINIAKRTSRAPISASKLHEPLLNLPAIFPVLSSWSTLRLLDCCNICLGDRWIKFGYGLSSINVTHDWTKFVTWREGPFAIFLFESELHDFSSEFSVNITSIWNMDQFDVIANQPIVIDNVRLIFTSMFNVQNPSNVLLWYRVM